MKNLKLIIAALMLVAFMGACNQATKKTEKSSLKESVKTEITYLSVEKILQNADTLSEKNVNLTGVIDHVCKHGGKRFKMLSSDGSKTIKVELGDNFKPADPSIAGKTVKVTGKLVPRNMDADMVKKWMEKETANHPDEVGTEAFKQEMATLQDIVDQIESGKIPYYTTYSVEAEKYEVE